MCHHVYSPRPWSHAQKHSPGSSSSGRISRAPGFSSPLVRAPLQQPQAQISVTHNWAPAFTHRLVPCSVLRAFQMLSVSKPFILLSFQPLPPFFVLAQHTLCSKHPGSSHKAGGKQKRAQLQIFIPNFSKASANPSLALCRGCIKCC